MYRSHVRPFVVLTAALALVAAFSCTRKNRPPSVPSVPAGPDSCFKDTTYAFSTIAVDPDGDSVAVRFDWDDSILSGWSKLAPSGDTVTMTHAWTKTGPYEVTVQARNSKLLSSNRSAGHTIRVVIPHTPPNAPAEPSGPFRGGRDSTYTFATLASHPDSLPVKIRFTWGGGDTSDWSSSVASGESVKMNHVWSVPDTYTVTAQAKDTWNAMSQWSVPHKVRIRAPDTLTIWRFKLAAIEGGAVYSSPAVGPDGVIYVGSLDNSLYAVNPNGTLRWSYPTGDGIRSSPAMTTDGSVCVGSYDDALYAVNPDGTLKWSFPTDRSVYASPAIGLDGTVYVGSLDQSLYAVNSGGSEKWNTHIVKAAHSSPAVGADGTIYVGSQDSSIYAVNTNGTVSWEHKTGGTIHSSPAIAADGTVYCGSDDGALYALSADGTLRWSYQTGGSVQASPAIASDGTVCVGSGDSCFYALNPNGTLKWRYRTGGILEAAPAVGSDGTVYFGSTDHYLYALNHDGSQKWQFESDGAVRSSPTIGSDGTVYFTSDDGYLYALKGTSPLAGSAWPKFHHDLKNTGRVGGGR